LEAIPGNRVPSADTLLRGIKELAVSNREHISNSGKSYQFNFNKKLNSLNIKSLLLTRQLECDKMYDFDYDNQFIVHDKYDAKRGYKKTKGYFPGVATMGVMPVFISPNSLYISINHLFTYINRQNKYNIYAIILLLYCKINAKINANSILTFMAGERVTS
jgi:hypothetical protein